MRTELILIIRPRGQARLNYPLARPQASTISIRTPISRCRFVCGSFAREHLHLGIAPPPPSYASTQVSMSFVFLEEEESRLRPSVIHGGVANFNERRRGRAGTGIMNYSVWSRQYSHVPPVQVDARSANLTSEANSQSVVDPPIPTGLPSQVEESLMSCPKFRIALIGKSGVGKSSLVQRFFNFDSSQVDISDHRPGEADIEREYTSSVNPRFIIHDSKGFEAGSEANWDTIESFLRRSVAYPELSRRIHAIWFCIETPRSGARLLQRGDERLLKLATDLKIPIVAVFTKYDLLENQFFMPGKAKKGTAASPEQQALEAYEGSVEELQAASNCVTVRISMKDRNLRDMLIKLANVTRGLLHEVEGQLWITWVTAQQASAQQKVDLSISEGCKSTYIPILHLGLTTDNNASEYWLNLGQSVVFEGQIMIDCVRRIHDDILKVWNFYDPDKILSSLDFFKGMIALAEPPEKETGVRPSTSGQVSALNDLTSVAGATGLSVLAPSVGAIGLSVLAANYLLDKYQRYPSTAKFLAMYIVNLVEILHKIFMTILPTDPPRALTRNTVFDAWDLHRTDLRTRPLDDIDSISGFSAHPEKVIAGEIKKRLGIS
ncbi:hypothetical protein NP233_g11999 [Leucocoprinus birnbaumii]|uniref:G domain-containing protein n=1 Tax=Leucocoprinus birnbaumii TaxID=56174 RepID=A0AAD5VGF7_9AGAR|nr:hypothetical protein NP233_g11999 [Leucocoprinus birnbaumii]